MSSVSFSSSSSSSSSSSVVFAACQICVAAHSAPLSTLPLPWCFSVCAMENFRQIGPLAMRRCVRISSKVPPAGSAFNIIRPIQWY